MAGLRIPGSLGSDTHQPSIDTGTLPLTASPEPGVIETANNMPSEMLVAGTTFDVEKAVEYLDKHAHSNSQGQCAKYVRQAIEAGGLAIADRPLYAKDYGPALTALGFTKVAVEAYTPVKGDIVVLQPPKGQTAGHIEIYNGTTWVSDFVQSQNIYPGPAYRKEKVSYEIYRP